MHPQLSWQSRRLIHDWSLVRVQADAQNNLCDRRNTTACVSSGRESRRYILIAIKILNTMSPKALGVRSLFSVGCLFFPSQLIYANLIMPEMLLQTAVMLSVYFMLDYFKNKQLRSLLFYQLSITASLLIKPVFLFFPFLSLILFFIIEKKITTVTWIKSTDCYCTRITFFYNSIDVVSRITKSIKQ